VTTSIIYIIYIQLQYRSTSQSTRW